MRLKRTCCLKWASFARSPISLAIASTKRARDLGESRSAACARCAHGFFEHDAFDAVLAQLPDDLQSVFAVAYVTAWCVKSEILTLAAPRTGRD